MIQSFELSTLESLAKILGDTDGGFTGSQIGQLLSETGFPDPLVGATNGKGYIKPLWKSSQRIAAQIILENLSSTR
ncbi:MAG: hypothetical protein NVV73_22425 [Cellvibrionaceae bacterium]|nr:hypothetical protein [Cellvibrionaceae bacterium]